MYGAVSMFARIPCLAGALTLVATPLLANEPAPDAQRKNRIFDGQVYLDDKVKADPALAADCLAEGRKWIDKGASEAESEHRQDPQLFRNGRFTYERRYNFRSLVEGHYVSIVRNDYFYEGGVHPNSDVNTILWDQTAKKRISIRPFFTETADGGPTLQAMYKAVIASLNIEKKKRDASDTATAEWYKELKPALLKIGAVTLAPSTQAGKSSGLTFHYPPYAVGPYAEGGYIAFVPWETLKANLSAEGAKIFGGARPKGDAEQ